MKTAYARTLFSFLAISANATAWQSKEVRPIQQPQLGAVIKMTGPQSTSLFNDTDRACPQANVRQSSPASLLDTQESFVSSLTSTQRKLLDRVEPKTANGGYVSCASENGATCSVEAGIHAIRKAGYMRQFVAFTCTRYKAR